MTRTPVLDRTIAAILDRQVAEIPDKPALIEQRGRSATYRELQQFAFSIANCISSCGVRRQEPVLVMLDNHIDIVATCVGLGVSGVIAVPINTAYKGEMLEYIIDHSGAKVAIVEDKYCDRIAEVLDGLAELQTVFVRGSKALLPDRLISRDFTELLASEPIRPRPPHVSEVACIIYTSGTEGRSKGVLCPHGLAFQTSASHPYETTPDDVVLVVLPLFHAGGLFAGVYNAFRAGATAIIHPGFSASRFWDDVRTFGCTQTLLIGAMIEFLWRQPPSDRDIDHPLRNLTVVPAVPYVSEFGKRFGMFVGSAYGQSETGINCITDDRDVGAFCCGRPRPSFEVKVVDEDDVEVAQGVTGEMVIRSNEPWSMFRGYHRDLAATIHATRNGWVHTGDAGYQDERGRFIFVDRKKDALRRRGENVSSMEVEKYLIARDDIVQAAIIAVPSEHLEDDIKAVIVLADDAVFDPEDILRDLVHRLPYFMVPRYYEALQELPMTATHKVSKVDLRKAGITPGTWDCEAHGFTVTRAGLREGVVSK
jgi:crotonobetaine/carnitine-CoA ligase